MRNILLSFTMILCWLATGGASPAQEGILSFVADPKTQDVRLYYKDDNSRRFGSLLRVKAECLRQGRRLLFAMNGGMFAPDHSPVGLFIHKGKVEHRLDTAAGDGNFYLQPNGVFYISSDRRAVICPSKVFRNDGKVFYANQSGPMLLIDGTYHPAFREGSANVTIRNGVGILPDGRILFAISRMGINFYEFARFFKEHGCRNALYLDGFVSQAWLPEKGSGQTGGDFGVMIGVSVPQ